MSQDKDELAKLLGELAAGQHTDEEAAHHADDDEHIGPLTEPESAPLPPAPSVPPKVIPAAPPVAKTEARVPPTPPRPAVKPAPPKPAVPLPPKIAAPPAAPPRAPVKPALPPRPAPVVKPAAVPPSPKPIFTPPPQMAPPPTPIPQAPAASIPIISDEEEPERYSGTDDDAVIVPAVAQTELAKPHAHAPRRQHLSQKLYFKQTVIPILLTLGVVCLIVPILGLVASQYSPFKTLAETYFMATFWPLGVAFLVFGLLTMFSVKKELEQQRALQQSA